MSVAKPDANRRQVDRVVSGPDAQEQSRSYRGTLVGPATLRSVAVLCVATNSIYKQLPGVDCYDAGRDARTFPGGMPVVAHPPCRAWSAFCAHQAKVPDGERELGVWCADQLRECGGVLEQPAHSRLFDAARLPKPGQSADGLTTWQVWQAWWGYPMKKATWLCFSRIDCERLELPFRLHAAGADRRAFQRMSKNQRAATCLPLAEWLLDAARQAAT